MVFPLMAGTHFLWWPNRLTPDGVFEHGDFIGQFRQTLLNIIDVFPHIAGAGPEHMVRMIRFVVDREDYVDQLREIGGGTVRSLESIFAMSVVFVSGLAEAEAKVEIEVTAVKP